MEKIAFVALLYYFHEKICQLCSGHLKPMVQLFNEFACKPDVATLCFSPYKGYMRYLKCLSKEECQ